MAIPGYDPDDIEEFVLERESERAGAEASVVAVNVPETFAIEASDADGPPNAVGDPVDLVDVESVEGVDAIRVTLAYDESSLPPDASREAVAIAVATDDGFEVVDSKVDPEEGEVSAVFTDRPSGRTLLAVHDEE